MGKFFCAVPIVLNMKLHLRLGSGRRYERTVAWLSRSFAVGKDCPIKFLISLSDEFGLSFTVIEKPCPNLVFK